MLPSGIGRFICNSLTADEMQKSIVRNDLTQRLQQQTEKRKLAHLMEGIHLEIYCDSNCRFMYLVVSYLGSSSIVAFRTNRCPESVSTSISTSILHRFFKKSMSKSMSKSVNNRKSKIANTLFIFSCSCSLHRTCTSTAQYSTVQYSTK